MIHNVFRLRFCSVNGVTGARDHLPADLKEFVARVRAATDKPLSVGFGISSAEQVEKVAAIADGVVVGSAFMHAIDKVRREDSHVLTVDVVCT